MPSNKKNLLNFYRFLLMFLLIGIIFYFENEFNPNSSDKGDLNINLFSDSNIINFSGYRWYIRDTGGEKEGPGPNYFINDNKSVWVDENGYLHLKIRKINGTWYCAEIFSEKSFGYGIYSFEMESGFEDLDINIVVGLFVYLDDNNEIDIEFSRWGQKNSDNAQFVVQPYYHFGNLHRFNIDQKEQDSIHKFQWCQNYIKFWSIWSEDSSIIQEWAYLGSDIPESSTEKVHINLWLIDGLAPSNNAETEVIIKKFEFKNNSCENPVIIFLIFYWYVIIILVGISIIILLLILKRQKIHKKISDNTI
ncbi:MAG: glycoside hydrolase family 16 protein [Promethearchaeota archaeon]